MPIIATLNNWDLADLFVTVIDLNLPGTILDNVRINEGQSIQIGVQPNRNGTGDITWQVQRVDEPDVTAERTVEVTAASTINVTANFG